MKNLQKGFTLVEIAIVLVIIGLLLGGILKGQEMIVQAKIKNVMADFSGLSAAYHGYQDRYRALPGDDPNAATRWATTTPAGVSGNGDGIVGGTYNQSCNPPPAIPTGESCYWWQDLRLSGFVSGNGPLQPFNAASGILGVQTGNGASPPVSVLGTTSGTTGTTTGGFVGLIACSANLPDKIAIAVDTQMDDGMPGTGTVRAVLQSSPNPTISSSSTPPANYEETGTNVYTLCRAM